MRIFDGLSPEQQAEIIYCCLYQSWIDVNFYGKSDQLSQALDHGNIYELEEEDFDTTFPTTGPPTRP